MGSKATTVGYTFTAKTPKLPNMLPIVRHLAKLSPAARQRALETMLAMKASMDAFSVQVQRLTDTARMTTGAMRGLRAGIEGYKARWAGKDDRAPDPQLEQIPASPFGWIVDVVSRSPGPKGGSTLLIPRRVETVNAAIERLANSTPWSRGQLRYVATVLEQSKQFDFWRIPKLMEIVVRCHTSGMPLDPHVLVQIASTFRFKRLKPA